MQSGSSVYRRQKLAARKGQEQQTEGADGRSRRQEQMARNRTTGKSEMSFANQNLTNFEKEMKSYAYLTRLQRSQGVPAGF
jgi:hypothetical protein